MQIIVSPDALAQWVGREFGPGEWLAVDQTRIQRFADATGDQQWIHTDPGRARAESPYRATIAHGYLTISLLPALLQSCLRIDGIARAINYGLDRVRLPAPVCAGQRIRARVLLERVAPVEGGGVQALWAATVEIEGGDRPACVAQMLARYFPVRSATP